MLIVVPFLVPVVLCFGSPLFVAGANLAGSEAANLAAAGADLAGVGGEAAKFAAGGGHYSAFLIAASLIVGILGLVIRIFVAGFAPKDTSGRNTKQQKASALNATGIYSICRNPLYLGNFFMWISPVILVGNWLFVLCFALFFWLYFERIAYAEEVFLREKFGEEFVRYCEKTPAFLPRFSLYQRPATTFSFRSMLRREYQSLFALASSLFLVHYLVALLVVRFATLPSFSVILSGFFVLCLMLWIICLFLVKRTKILEVEGR